MTRSRSPWLPAPSSSPSSASGRRRGATSVVLAAVVCVLTLTIAGPSERISRSAPKMKQLEATEPQLRAQIDRTRAAESQTRRPGLHCGAGAQRLAFVMAGDATYQVRCRRWRRCPARPAVKPKPCRPISRGTRRCGTPLPMSHMELRRRPRRRRRLQRPLPTAPPGARQEGGRREGRRALHQGIREPRGSHRLRPPCGRHALHHSTPDIQALMLLTPGYRRRSFRPYMCGYSGLVAPPR